MHWIVLNHCKQVEMAAMNDVIQCAHKLQKPISLKFHHSPTGHRFKSLNIMRAKRDKWLTLSSQQIGIEAQEVSAEVEPPLAGHFAFPVAAWIVCDELFLWRQLKPLLKPQQGLSELFWVVLQHQRRLALLSNEALASQPHSGWAQTRAKTSMSTNLTMNWIFLYQSVVLQLCS